MFEEKKQKSQSRHMTMSSVQDMIMQGKLSVAQERYLRMRYGISEGPSHTLQRIPMPEKTAKVVEGLEAMLVNRMGHGGSSSLKREAIIGKLRSKKG